MRENFNGRKNEPHAEEPAKRASRSTHGGSPARGRHRSGKRRCPHWPQPQDCACGGLSACCAPSRSWAISTVRSNATTGPRRSEEHTSELQSLMRISYAVFCLKKKTNIYNKLIK